MEFALSLISIENIIDLPILLSGPAVLLIFLFLVRCLRSLFSLHLVTAVTSLMYAFAIAVILSHFGMPIAEALGLDVTTVASTQQ